MVRRLMVAVAASAVIFGLLAAYRVPAPGYFYAGVACFAVCALAHAARNPADLASALVAIACGIFVGVLFDDPCTPVGTLVGPLAGYLVRLATCHGRGGRRPAAAFLESSAGEQPA